jgi:hypothetical protein
VLNSASRGKRMRWPGLTGEKGDEWGQLKESGEEGGHIRIRMRPGQQQMEKEQQTDKKEPESGSPA